MALLLAATVAALPRRLWGPQLRRLAGFCALLFVFTAIGGWAEGCDTGGLAVGSRFCGHVQVMLWWLGRASCGLAELGLTGRHSNIWQFVYCEAGTVRQAVLTLKPRIALTGAAACLGLQNDGRRGLY